MIYKPCLFILALSFVTTPLYSQVKPEATGGDEPAVNDTQMMTPPQVIGVLYPKFTGAEVRSNYLAIELTFNSAYIDNVLPGAADKPVSDTTYSILPEFTLDRTRPRQQLTLTYSPTMIFYEPTKALNSIDHSVSAMFQDRLTPHVSIDMQDYFLKTSDWFSTSSLLSAEGNNGPTQAPIAAPDLIVPFAKEISNTAEGALSYQFARNGMVGLGGTYSHLTYPHNDAPGLFDSTGEGASAFYNRRLSAEQYIGLSYEYDRYAISPANPPLVIQTHAFLPFYTMHFTPEFSVSLSGGAQHLNEDQNGPQEFKAWAPIGVINAGWQGKRGDFRASYTHTVTSGGGLYGAFYSNNMSEAGGWKFSSSWSGRIEVSYATTSAVTKLTGLDYNGGNAFTVGAALRRTFGEHFSAEFGYDRLQENYAGLAIVTQNPDSDRGYVTITYELRKPLGR